MRSSRRVLPRGRARKDRRAPSAWVQRPPHSSRVLAPTRAGGSGSPRRPQGVASQSGTTTRRNATRRERVSVERLRAISVVDHSPRAPKTEIKGGLGSTPSGASRATLACPRRPSAPSSLLSSSSPPSSSSFASFALHETRALKLLALARARVTPHIPCRPVCTDVWQSGQTKLWPGRYSRIAASETVRPQHGRSTASERSRPENAHLRCAGARVVIHWVSSSAGDASAAASDSSAASSSPAAPPMPIAAIIDADAAFWRRANPSTSRAMRVRSPSSRSRRRMGSRSSGQSSGQCIPTAPQRLHCKSAGTARRRAGFCSSRRICSRRAASVSRSCRVQQRRRGRGRRGREEAEVEEGKEAREAQRKGVGADAPGGTGFRICRRRPCSGARCEGEGGEQRHRRGTSSSCSSPSSSSSRVLGSEDAPSARDGPLAEHHDDRCARRDGRVAVGEGCARVRVRASGGTAVVVRAGSSFVAFLPPCEPRRHPRRPRTPIGPLAPASTPGLVGAGTHVASCLR